MPFFMKKKKGNKRGAWDHKVGVGGSGTRGRYGPLVWANWPQRQSVSTKLLKDRRAVRSPLTPRVTPSTAARVTRLTVDYSLGGPGPLWTTLQKTQFFLFCFVWFCFFSIKLTKNILLLFSSTSLLFRWRSEHIRDETRIINFFIFIYRFIWTCQDRNIFFYSSFYFLNELEQIWS